MGRKYSQIWKQIKETDACIIEIVHPAFVERVRIGVIKEKNRDLAFKLMNEEKFRLKVEYDKETRRMSFKLTQRFGMAEKVVV